MAITVGELRERLAKIPPEAKLYWYTGQALGMWRTKMQAEWHDDKGDLKVDEVLSYSGEMTSGGHVE